MTQRNDTDPITNQHLSYVIDQAKIAEAKLDAGDLGVDEVNAKARLHQNIVRAVEADTLRRINSAPAGGMRKAA